MHTGRLWNNCMAYKFDYKDICLGFKTKILNTLLLVGKRGIFRAGELSYCKLLTLLPLRNAIITPTINFSI